MKIILNLFIGLFVVLGSIWGSAWLLNHLDGYGFASRATGLIGVVIGAAIAAYLPIKNCDK